MPPWVRHYSYGEVAPLFLLASLPIGSILGIPIRVHWSAPAGLLILGVTSWLHFRNRPFAPTARRMMVELMVIAAVAVIVLIHELAHALAAKICGVRTRGIYLHIFGGLALSTDPAVLNLKPWQEMAVFAAGPVTNLICCVPAALLAGVPDSRVLTKLLVAFVVMNLWMAIFNLLPIWPLDGGQLFRSFLALIRLKSRLSDWITLVVSLLFGVPFAYLAWEFENYWLLSVLLVLMTAGVVLLAIWGHEPDKPSDCPTNEAASATAECPGFQAVLPASKME